MKTVLLVSSDSKTVSQMMQWLKDLGAELDITTYTSFVEFQKEQGLNISLAHPVVPSLKDLTAPAEEAKSSLHLVIADVEDLMRQCKEPVRWFEALQAQLQLNGVSVSTSHTRLCALGFESSAFNADHFRSDAVDDLLMKPLDRTLFLQKMEILLSDKKQISPSFLFRQPTQMIIEMAKDSQIEYLSEIGLIIKNPVALAHGVSARMYSPVFGERGHSGLYARVFKSMPHPTQKGSYFTYFTFFGIEAHQLMNVRKALRGIKPKDTELVKLKPAPPDPKKNILVIDMNRDSTGTLREVIQSNFQNADVHVISSYANFLKMLQPPAPASPAAAADPSKAAVPPKKGTSEGVKKVKGVDPAFGKITELSLIVAAESRELIETEPPLKTTDPVFGLSFEELKAEPTLWATMIESAFRADFDEFMSYVRTGQKAVFYTQMTNSKGDHYTCSIAGRMDKTGEVDGLQTLKLTFKEITLEELHKHQQEEQHNHAKGLPKPLHALFIDGSNIKTDIGPWIEGLREMLSKSHIAEKTQALPIFILGEEKSRLHPETFRHPSVEDFVRKPFDRKQITQKLGLLIPGLSPANEHSDIAFVPIHQKLQLAKDVLMEQVSEFSLQIKTGASLREGIMIRFFSPLFWDDRSDGILARCHYTVADENNKGEFHSFFNFFGVTDSMLKRIRTWIREEYVNKKAKE